MRVGILTFHWATNYGAILQAWCLQEFIAGLGFDVDIINYKPANYDFSWRYILTHPKLWKSIRRLLVNREKESLLSSFRKQYLHTTKRYKTACSLKSDLGKYDVLISGSDQVLNPGFTLHGEKGKPCPVYWLGVGKKKTRRIGYAVSFGREKYPDDAAMTAMQWVNDFNAIGAREQTGLQILNQLGYSGTKCVTPDPTMLLGKKLYSRIGIDIHTGRESYTCIYMLRHEIKMEGNVRYIDEVHRPLSMKQWLETIAHSARLVTNSYHGTLMAIYAHVPFVVLLETGRGSRMNDRFYTLLKRIGCEDRVAMTFEEAEKLIYTPMDYSMIDIQVESFMKEGVAFLEQSLASEFSRK